MTGDVVGYMEYKGVAEITSFFTTLFARLKPDPNGKPTQNLTKIGPLNGTPSVKTGSALAANSVFLTWRTDGLPEPIDLATDTFTFRKDGDAYRIWKQNIVSTEPSATCSNGTNLAQCDQADKTCAGWANHFAAFDVQNDTQIMDDYTEESLVQVYDNVKNDGNYTFYKGKTEIQNMFKALFQEIGPKPNNGVAVKVLDVDVTRKTVFLVWTSNSHPKATDTFIFDDAGKILTQTIVVSTKTSLATEILI